MKEQLIAALHNIKEHFNKLSKKSKIILITVFSLVVIVSVGFTIFLNVQRSGYVVLFPNITAEESNEVYTSLQAMEVIPQVNAKGQVMVPREQYDSLILDLAGKGFPKSAPNYGIFTDNTGFTKTEFEKKQALLFQLQNRLQETLSRIEGVRSAIVTINVPNDSTYVWDKDKSEPSTASVLVEMEGGITMSPERVAAIKSLTSGAVPKLLAENVGVFDAKTGIEMQSAGDLSSSNMDPQGLVFQREIELDIVNKVKQILTPKYGADGVFAVATVALDFDKMMTERKEMLTQEDGSGMKTHDEEMYSINGEVPAAGLVGEENNTDIPQYNAGADGTGGMTNYQRSADYDFGYIKTQIEKGQAAIKTQSVSVLVNDPAFDTATHDVLVDLIAKGTSIDPMYISVSNLDLGIEPDTTEPEVPQDPGISTRMIIILIAAFVLLILLLILIFALISAHKKKKKRLLEEAEAQEAALREAELKSLQDEIDAHKKAIAHSAFAANNTKESAITEEIKEFAKENPEIAASLIRSWLKEEEA